MKHTQHQDIEKRIFELADARPASALIFPLRDLAHEALSEGYSREELIEDFGRVRLELREDQEDAVTDVMDFLYGWSANHMKL